MNSANVRSFEVRPLDSTSARQCLFLSAQRFGFAELDQTPPWLIDTMVQYGGFALGAFCGESLIGYSMSFPGFILGQSFLFSCALAVDHGFESLGVGMALKLAQRELALDAGYDLIRWTTTSLSSGPLHLYLSKLGCRITRFHADMFRYTIHPDFPDEVEIEWSLNSFPPPPREYPSGATILTSSEPAQDGVRRLVAADVPRDQLSTTGTYLVEIPWDREALLCADADAAAAWSRYVRTVMRTLLDYGYVGTQVWPQRTERRSFVQFERAERTA
jgi:predicted GNAT superfamily acetyltransferase